METSLNHPPLEEIAGRTIAGFWRRSGAFLIDILILGILGNVLALAFFDPLARIGDLGRGIGFIIALLYFGVQNSEISGGQSVGKRLLGIKVVDKSGNLIGPARAHARAAILILPYFFNMFQVPFLKMPAPIQMVIFVLGTVAVFGLGMGIVYLYLFNTRTRQSFHDLIFGTFVVTKDAGKVAPMREILWVHKAVVACLLAISLIGPFFLGMRFGPGPGLMRLYYDLAWTGKYTFITFQDTRRLGGGPPFTSLNIVVWLREEPGTFDAAAEEIVRQVVSGFPEVETKDILAVTVGRGVDIGIGSISHTRTFHQSPMDWGRQLEEGNTWDQSPDSRERAVTGYK